MKKASLLLIAIAMATTIFSSSALAATPDTNDISDHFSFILKRNAIIVNYAVEEDKRLGTYPKGVGAFIAEKQQSDYGEWYYGNKLYSGKDGFIFNGQNVKNMELANIHYGYIGRAAGFAKSQLINNERASQISPSPENWAFNYFSVLGLKGIYWITYGANLYDNKNLQHFNPSFSMIEELNPSKDLLSNDEKQQIKNEMFNISQKINANK
ncbi:polymorphic toxin type 44 domain-containing protein [Bacillus cereus]|uniref:polymorphic toxin type 44 domain-containing protein n=1 Tax=Bacillus cereus TaxID=1396 RepID=UPI0005CF0019|nr:polymorphic toxin type 44 domain-containing protein [Bacillus cereus]